MGFYYRLEVKALYLKSLEIHGFKSFADKTKLEFGPGVTCIVGPNGSGKSNVCDALRWVLGEQSLKTLRGARLEDIIFNGSEGRRPLGMASVTLLFDNSSGLLPIEYNEVTVSRRVYRSGESEFLINQVPSRLKDIQGLFNDTGLGKEAFAIIGQGQIDVILSTRPEDRRALFEEAAGIVRYRNRKQEATRKLEGTSVNLERLQDLIYELKQNLAPMKKEAEKARIYGEKKEELISLEISLTCLDLDKKLSQQEAVAETINNLQNTLWEKESNYALVNANWEETKLIKEKLEEQEREHQQLLYSLQQEMGQLEKEEALCRERMASILEREVAIEEDSVVNQQKLAELEERWGQEQQQLENLKITKGPQEEALNEGERQQTIYQQDLAAYQKQREQLRNNLFDAEQKLISLHNKQLETQFELKNLEQQQHRLAEDEQRFEGQKKELFQRFESITNKLQDKQARLEMCSQETIQITDEAYKLRAKIVELKGQRDNLQEVQHGVRSRIRILMEMQENLEGYHFGVRNLFKGPIAKGELQALGIVGELMNVPHQYEQAIETALGNAVQYIVTETDQDAQKAIEWLKQEKAGRGTFLPLNTLQPRKLANQFRPFLGEKGVLGLASDLVQVKPGQEVILDYLLGTVIVVTDLIVAVALAKKSRFSLKIVTLDGDIIFPGGSLTGGSQKRSGTGLLGRSREIAEQEEKLEKVVARQANLQANIQTCAKKEEIIIGAEQELREESQRLQAEITSQTMEQERLEQEILGQEKEMEAHHWAKEELLLEQNKLQQKLKIIEQEERVGNKRKEEILETIEQYKKQGEIIKEKTEVLAASLVEQKLHLTSQREKQKALENALAYYQQNKQEVKTANERLLQEISQLQQRKETTENNRSLLKQQVVQLMEKHQKCKGIANELETEKQEKIVELRSLETQVGKLTKEIKELKDRYHQLEVQKNRQEVEWENTTSRLQEKFQLSMEEAKKHQLHLPSPAEASARVRILKKEIDILGPINPNATLEYERLEERYQFLVEQQLDLLEAKEGLFRIIEEMETIMSQKFKKTFKAVQIAFQEVFSYLFGGGTASLELTETDNILGSGVEIIAQPPGKRMQNLLMLSGGERALTAAAVLFALLKVKPSPFCVLDEIEANLDEVNVERFAGYLQEFSADTQFILVSHRQGTMEVADALYGVTMVESGVSSIVSAKLTLDEEVS